MTYDEMMSKISYTSLFRRPAWDRWTAISLEPDEYEKSGDLRHGWVHLGDGRGAWRGPKMVALWKLDNGEGKAAGYLEKYTPTEEDLLARDWVVYDPKELWPVNEGA